jgi:hypothetical protein
MPHMPKNFSHGVPVSKHWRSQREALVLDTGWLKLGSLAGMENQAGYLSDLIAFYCIIIVQLFLSSFYGNMFSLCLELKVQN